MTKPAPRQPLADRIECAIGLSVNCGGTVGVHRARDAVLAAIRPELDRLAALDGTDDSEPGTAERQDPPQPTCDTCGHKLQDHSFVGEPDTRCFPCHDSHPFAWADPDDALHFKMRHPDWEYDTTEGQRKSWDGQDTPPEGDGWVRNTAYGRNGWERFDYHEESYWRRPKPVVAAEESEDKPKTKATYSLWGSLEGGLGWNTYPFRAPIHFNANGDYVFDATAFIAGYYRPTPETAAQLRVATLTRQLADQKRRADRAEQQLDTANERIRELEAAANEAATTQPATYLTIDISPDTTGWEYAVALTADRKRKVFDQVRRERDEARTALARVRGALEGGDA